METQRLLLYLALGFLSLIMYQSWVQDYHAPLEPVAQYENTGNGAPEQPVNAVDIPSAADIPQNAENGVSAVPANSASSNSIDTPAVSVTTDVLRVRVNTLGATIEQVELLDYPVSIDDQETPFKLVSSEPRSQDIDLYARQLRGRCGLSSPKRIHRRLECVSVSTDEAQAWH